MEPTDGELPPLDAEVVEPAPLEAELVEPPMVRPARPGPGILMALVWWVVLLVVQLAVGIGLAVVFLIVAAVRRGQEAMREAAKGSSTWLFDIPGATLAMFIAAGLGNVLTAAGMVAIFHRGRALRTMAIRGLSLRHAILIMMLVPPSYLIGAELQLLAMRVLPHMTGNEEMYKKLGEQPWAAVLIAGCLLPGLGEELYFRAFIGRGLVARHGVWLGTLLTAGLFGTMHLDPPQVVGTAALGLVFHFAYLNTKSFFGPALFHALNNAMAFGLMRLATSPTGMALLDDDVHVPPLMLAGAAAGLLSAGWLLYATRTHWVLPDGGVWSPGYVSAESPPAHLGATPRHAVPSVIGVLAAIGGYALFVASIAWELRALFR